MGGGGYVCAEKDIITQYSLPPHSVVHGVTVAIFMKMRNLQFCLLLWLSNDALRLKKVKEPNWTS